ncbi:MAG TPA: ankyrin repeat domain-containing protein [Gemmatimonadaceae bacterium]|nr:ankyrin repeat domain-containing protein [Gemmatimonadaceae bacterium]
MRAEFEDHEDIHAAARAGDNDEVAAILSMDNRLTRSLDRDGWTPLHLAAHHGHAAVVETLLANNADVNARSGDGRTALEIATQAGRAEVAALLRANGAI